MIRALPHCGLIFAIIFLSANPARAAGVVSETAYRNLTLADGPLAYHRFSEAAGSTTARNSGSLGSASDGVFSAITNNQPGPRPTNYFGFESTNAAVAFNGTNSFITLGSPEALNILGPVTLEAWIQPAPVQNAVAEIIGHGGTEAATGVFLRIIDGTTYAVESVDEGGIHGTSAPVPAEDLTGGQWVHLAGTYDGTSWKLFRNGVLLASTDDATGAVAVSGGSWVLGGRADGAGGGFTGLMDESAIYSKALTAAQISAHYTAASIGVAPQSQPGLPQENGLNPVSATVYVNPPDTTLNNDNTEALGVAVLSNGNVVVGWEDDGSDLGDQEAVWTMLNPSGTPLTPLTMVTSIDPAFAGQTLQTRFLSYFRADGSAVSGRTSWGPKLKANLFGEGFGMGATSFDLGLEVPEFAAIQNTVGGQNAGDFPSVQLLNNNGSPLGIVSGVTDAYAEREGDIRIGDWDRLSNGNLVIVGESRQKDDLVNIYGGVAPLNHGIVRIVGTNGTEIKSEQLLGDNSAEVAIWHGTAVTTNGFAVRYASDNRAKIKLFTNAGTPVGGELDAATITGSEISAGGGRGEDIGFAGNGKDAYVLATAGTDTNGAAQIWVAVLNADGTKRWARTVSDSLTFPHGTIGRVDAAIDSTGRVAVVYADTAATTAAGGTTPLILGRVFDPQGSPSGGIFLVSEREVPSSTTLDATEPRVDWRGNIIAVTWLSKNLVEGNPDSKAVVAARIFQVGGSFSPTVTIAANADGTVTVTFNGTLQSSASAVDGYVNVTGAVSPWKVTPPPGSSAQFYRATAAP